SLADEVQKKAKEAGLTINGMEGQGQAEWILIDIGDVVCHVMMADTRQLYDLESLWGMSPSTAE
ncbi:MAG: ribosome silencing factor, partial [Gammaproteobacteria bacterium]|nr:ribosome silencing factor [Gammaproteobacteria bacterium]